MLSVWSLSSAMIDFPKIGKNLGYKFCGWFLLWMTWESGMLNCLFGSQDVSAYHFFLIPLIELKVRRHYCIVYCPLDDLLYCNPQTELCVAYIKLLFPIGQHLKVWIVFLLECFSFLLKLNNSSMLTSNFLASLIKM